MNHQSLCLSHHSPRLLLLKQVHAHSDKSGGALSWLPFCALCNPVGCMFYTKCLEVSQQAILTAKTQLSVIASCESSLGFLMTAFLKWPVLTSHSYLKGESLLRAPLNTMLLNTFYSTCIPYARIRFWWPPLRDIGDYGKKKKIFYFPIPHFYHHPFTDCTQHQLLRSRI